MATQWLLLTAHVGSRYSGIRSSTSKLAALAPYTHAVLPGSAGSCSGTPVLSNCSLSKRWHRKIKWLWRHSECAIFFRFPSAYKSVRNLCWPATDCSSFLTKAEASRPHHSVTADLQQQLGGLGLPCSGSFKVVLVLNPKRLAHGLGLTSKQQHILRKQLQLWRHYVCYRWSHGSGQHILQWREWDYCGQPSSNHFGRPHPQHRLPAGLPGQLFYRLERPGSSPEALRHHTAHPQPGYCWRLTDGPHSLLHCLPHLKALGVRQRHVQGPFLPVPSQHVCFHLYHHPDECLQAAGRPLAAAHQPTHREEDCDAGAGCGLGDGDDCLHSSCDV